MKSNLSIWADEKDEVKVKIDAYSGGEYFVRINVNGSGINDTSLYLNVEQAREVQKQLLDVALNAKYNYKKRKMPSSFSEEYHKEIK